MSRVTIPIALFLAARYVAAQTSTTCNPLNATCPQDPALGTTFSTTFNSSMTEFDPSFFNVTAGIDLITFSDSGADLTISEQGQSVTIETAFYILFGQVEVLFEAASGQGIISTFNMLSDDLDEIDWEIMGGNTSFVENNFYGWGNQTQHNALYYPTAGANWQGGAMGGVHNFTVDWSQEQIQWIMDGDVVRTQTYQPAGQYPQTPCYLKFGIWAGGDPAEPPGTITWAGGPTDYSKGPFTMTVQSLRVSDAHTNVSYYSYGDQSGTWQSIKMLDGESPAYKAMHELSDTQSAEQQWNGLSTGAKIGIACGVVGFLLICFAVFTVFCIKQRRQGKREKAIADKAWDAQNAELMDYRNRMKKGDFAVHHMGHGEKF